MMNGSIPIAVRNNLAPLSRFKAHSNSNPYFGMTAKNPTEKEKQTAVHLQKHGNRVIADKVNDIWKILCRCGHQVLGRSGGDLQEIAGQASGHKH